ncbi:ankyrin repeat domain-containing protein 35 [Anolis carolinensis]|uniref:ankyrin repeat domain-containing protein 35 n=1 Tax=Anolis carolinensis TaxID=28377 RepID=UPI002F2B49E8
MKKMFSCSSNQVAFESWNKQDQKLLDAVEKGDVGRVSALTAKKAAKPTKLNALGQSAFHLAASKGLTECLTILLTNGAQVNDTNDDGSTALHLATIACQPQCVKVLLQHGANEDCVDGENRTPLHWAALSGCASSVLLLCDQEAFLDVMDNNGQTPLMVAAQGNQAAICSQLLQRGAKADLIEKEGKTALILACQQGHLEVAELLLQNGADVSIADKTGRDALHYSAQNKNKKLRRLVQNALRKRKKKEQGLDLSSETVSQIPSESGKETEVNSLSLNLNGRNDNNGDNENDDSEEEDPELKEWRSRYREEKLKVIQLELALAQKDRECEALSEGSKAMKERVWDQVQEINQLLPDGDGQSRGWNELSQRYSRDATEEDYYLNLLAEQVRELKRRKERMEKEKEEEKGSSSQKETSQPREIQWPGVEDEEERRRHEMEVKGLQLEVATALEEKIEALKQVQEMEGHMENMRAVIKVYESKKKHQKEAEARAAELEEENQRLRGMLTKKGPDGDPQKGFSAFLTEMEATYEKTRKENEATKAENAALKREAEETLGSRLLFQEVPSGVVKKAMFAWKKAVEGLEGALDKVERAHSTLLEKARPLWKDISLVVVNNGCHVEENVSKDENVKICVINNGHHVEENVSKDENVKVRVINNGHHVEENVSKDENVKICVINNGHHVEENVSKDENVKVRVINNGHHVEENVSKDENVKICVINNGHHVEENVSKDAEKARNEAGNAMLGRNEEVKLRLTESKARPCRKSSDLEKEVWDLKQNNGHLATELSRLSKEREKLQQELRTLCGPKEGSRQLEMIEEMKRRVELLSKELLAEKEVSEKLRLELAAQAKETAATKARFLEKMEATSLFGAETLNSCILKELHWKLDNVAKKQSKALQLVSEMEEENLNQSFHQSERTVPDIPVEALDAVGDNLKVRQVLVELEDVLRELKEALDGAEKNEVVSKLKGLVDRMVAAMATLRQEEEEALRKHEKVRGMLSVRAQVLAGELATLRDKFEEARGEAGRRAEALESEARMNRDLLEEMAEHEEEVEELRGKTRRMESTIESLGKKVEELSKAGQEKEAKFKKLLKETEKFSSEILNLRSERTRLLLQNEVAQKNHQEIVAIYRTHLLNAAQGFMDKEVHEMLQRILRTNDD